MLYEARENSLSPPLTGGLLVVPATVHPSSVPEKYASHYLSLKQNADAPLLNKESVDNMINLYKPDPESPLFNVLKHPKGHQGLPPVYLLACGLDPIRDDALLLERAIREEGGSPTKIDLWPGVPHVFWAVFPTLSQVPQLMGGIIGAAVWLLGGGK